LYSDFLLFPTILQKKEKTRILPKQQQKVMGLCASAKLEDSSNNSKSHANANSEKKNKMVEKSASMSGDEYFTSLTQSTTLQLSSRNKFVNSIPSTLLQVATDKTKSDSSRPSDGTLPFLQQALESVADLDLKKDRAGALASYMTLVCLKDGETFIKKGEEVKGLYVVESGSIALPNGTIVKAGQSFGSDALLRKHFAEGDYCVSSVGNSVTSSSAVAVDDASSEGETKQQPKSPTGVRLWAIHRLIYQAVLIDIAKTSGSKAKAAIDKIPFFAPLPAASKNQVSAALQNGYRKYKAGTKIIAQNDPATSMYFIISGEVVVYQKSRGDAEAKEVNRHGPGKFFGESAIKSVESTAGSVSLDIYF
jgi:CRP-like cAMP-binding protein